MEFSLTITKENPYSILRQCGYKPIDEKHGETSSVRTLGAAGYPRFHLYVKRVGEKTLFSLHLDQKRPIYKGAKAHSGEYEGIIVEAEAKRIKQLILDPGR